MMNWFSKKISVSKTINFVKSTHYPYPEIVSLSVLKACHAMNLPGDAAISLYKLALPLTYAMYT